MQVIQQQFAVSFSYPVLFTRDMFDVRNPALADVISSSGRPNNRALVLIDSEVARLNPGLLEKISRYGEAHKALFEFVAPPFLLRGGEICKHEPIEIEKIQALVERHKICRHSYILAIGGGAVLDAAGYAAATSHRGVRLIRVPTTVLAQNDAGIGVKNGINAFGRKNFLGTFAPPYAVINDLSLLESLHARDMRAGMAEAVKVALIKDREFFSFLYRARYELCQFAPSAMEKMIVRCAQLHLEHIATGGDPFECGSSRPLDFGHWVAHKLEELSGYELRHGEAVAIGIALDSLYSHRIGLLSKMDLHRIITLLETLGFDLYHPALSWLGVERALADFREHLGGELSIPLLQGIGKKVEAHEIDIPVMKACIANLSDRADETTRNPPVNSTALQAGVNRSA